MADAHPRRNGGDAPERGQRSKPAARAPAGARRQWVESPALDRADRSAIASPSAACRACTRLPGSTPTCGFRITRSTFRCRRSSTTDTTKVIYGVNELDLELAGKPVSEIWKVLEQVFNIPRDAVVTVNGTRVDDTHVVRAGDELEFTKAAGVKGLAA